MKPNPVFALVAAGLARAAARRPAWPRRRRRRALVVAVALFALLAGASRAAAAVTAKFNDSTDTVLVNMTATGDVASVWREGDAIRVNGPVTGAPTVTSADVVVFDDNPDLDSTVSSTCAAARSRPARAGRRRPPRSSSPSSSTRGSTGCACSSPTPAAVSRSAPVA